MPPWEWKTSAFPSWPPSGRGWWDGSPKGSKGRSGRFKGPAGATTRESRGGRAGTHPSRSRYPGRHRPFRGVAMGWPKMVSRFDKAVSFTVDADREQSDRWGEAAAELCMSVASWLADTADAHLRERARSGRATPLPWFRDRFPVTL